MTVEANIFTAIKGLCGNRAFPDIAPIDTAKPYVTYTQIGGEGMATVGGVSSLRHGRFQFNVWGDSRISCVGLINQIEAALVAASSFKARPIGAPSSSYDFDMKLYGSMQDFSIYSPR